MSWPPRFKSSPDSRIRCEWCGQHYDGWGCSYCDRGMAFADAARRDKDEQPLVERVNYCTLRRADGTLVLEHKANRRALEAYERRVIENLRLNFDAEGNPIVEDVELPIDDAKPGKRAVRVLGRVVTYNAPGPDETLWGGSVLLWGTGLAHLQTAVAEHEGRRWKEQIAKIARELELPESEIEDLERNPNGTLVRFAQKMSKVTSSRSALAQEAMLSRLSARRVLEMRAARHRRRALARAARDVQAPNHREIRRARQRAPRAAGVHITGSRRSRPATRSTGPPGDDPAPTEPPLRHVDEAGASRSSEANRTAREWCAWSTGELHLGGSQLHQAAHDVRPTRNHDYQAPRVAPDRGLYRLGLTRQAGAATENERAPGWHPGLVARTVIRAKCGVGTRTLARNRRPMKGAGNGLHGRRAPA